MTTIVNNPAPVAETSSGIGMILGLIFLAAAVLLFFLYGLPAIRRLGSPQINIPNKIDVNISQQNK